MTKISDLTALTSPHSTDELVIVDKTDLTQGTGGTTKKITRTNFITGLAANGANSDITSLSGLTTPLSVLQGGTGTTTSTGTGSTVRSSGPTLSGTPKVSSNFEIQSGNSLVLDNAAGNSSAFLYNNGASGASILQADVSVAFSSPGNTTNSAVTTSATQTLSNKTIDTASTNTIKVGGVDISTAWTTWAPTFSGSASLTYTSVTTNYASYKQIGKTVYVRLRCTGTTGGTDSYGLRFTFPVAPHADYYANTFTNIGSGNATNPIGVFATALSSTICEVIRSDGANWGLGTRAFSVVLVYEAA